MIKELETMTLKTMKTKLKDAVDERNRYPENSKSKKAIEIDNYCFEIDNSIHILEDFQKEMREYIMDETVRKERFSDIEICTEDDNYLANDILNDMISEYTIEDMINFFNAIKRDCDIVEGGWMEGGKYYP